MNHASMIHGTYQFEVKRKNARRRYSPPVLSNDTLHLFVHHTREFTSTKRSAGYSTDNNVTLDTVQCAYTIHIYKSTFARSADRCVCSPCLSFSRTLFRSLPLSRSPFSLSATKVGTVFFTISRIVVNYLNNNFKLAVTFSG